MKLKILGIEPAIGKTSKQVYYKVKTDKGIMTVFDGDIVEALKKSNFGEELNLNVVQTEKDGRTYQNIRGFAMDDEAIENAGCEHAENEVHEYVKPQEFGKAAQEITDAMLRQKAYDTRKSVKGSAYEKDPVGLAAEVFCALFEDKESAYTPGNCMEVAIELVKQAQKAFS